MTFSNVRGVHQGRRKVEAPMKIGHGDLTGSERSHISVSYHDGPLDASESMYCHETFPLHERWHSSNGHFTAIVARIFGLGVLVQLQLSCVQSPTSTACAKVSYRLAKCVAGVCSSLMVC